MIRYTKAGDWSDIDRLLDLILWSYISTRLYVIRDISEGCGVEHTTLFTLSYHATVYLF